MAVLGNSAPVSTAVQPWWRGATNALQPQIAPQTPLTQLGSMGTQNGFAQPTPPIYGGQPPQPPVPMPPSPAPVGAMPPDPAGANAPYQAATQTENPPQSTAMDEAQKAQETMQSVLGTKPMPPQPAPAPPTMTKPPTMRKPMPPQPGVRPAKQASMQPRVVQQTSPMTTKQPVGVQPIANQRPLGLAGGAQSAPKY